MLLSLLFFACIRPSDNYEVRIHGEGTQLDEMLPAPVEMGGRIEIARFRLWGTNLGTGITSFYGDSPRADGTSFVVANAEFSYPVAPGYDRNSTFVNPGPRVLGEDMCITRARNVGWIAASEYVDVGDHISLVANDGNRILLERDPSAHNASAGESWYSSYGNALQPVVQNHQRLHDTWRSGESWGIHFPGTVLPPHSTMGSIPYPLLGAAMRFPGDIEGLTINGAEVRPPHHGYDEFEDDVRFAGPFDGRDMVLHWNPSPLGDALTISLRYLGRGEEGSCDCNTDCGPGFSCEQSQCVGEEGATYNILGEVTCTVADDGEFLFASQKMETLNQWVHPSKVFGSIVVVSRLVEDTIDVPDVLTHNGRRVPISPVRTRAIDAIVTRLEWP